MANYSVAPTVRDAAPKKLSDVLLVPYLYLEKGLCQSSTRCKCLANKSLYTAAWKWDHTVARLLPTVLY